MVADKILSSVAQPYLVDGHPLGTTPSIGIALYPHDGDDMSTLMKCADIAMHQAKETGRGRFCFFFCGSRDAFALEVRSTFVTIVCLYVYHSAFAVLAQPFK